MVLGTWLCAFFVTTLSLYIACTFGLPTHPRSPWVKISGRSARALAERLSSLVSGPRSALYSAPPRCAGRRADSSDEIPRNEGGLRLADSRTRGLATSRTRGLADSRTRRLADSELGRARGGCALGRFFRATEPRGEVSRTAPGAWAWTSGPRAAVTPGTRRVPHARSAAVARMRVYLLAHDGCAQLARALTSSDDVEILSLIHI